MGLVALGMGKVQREKSCAYKRLGGGGGGGGRQGCCRKGYVPVMVGSEGEEGEMERIMIPMKLIMHPCIVSLLESSAGELGYSQPGTLRIQCDVHGFKSLLDSISHRRTR